MFCIRRQFHCRLCTYLLLYYNRTYLTTCLKFSYADWSVCHTNILNNTTFTLFIHWHISHIIFYHSWTVMLLSNHPGHRLQHPIKLSGHLSVVPAQRLDRAHFNCVCPTIHNCPYECRSKNTLTYKNDWNSSLPAWSLIHLFLLDMMLPFS